MVTIDSDLVCMEQNTLGGTMDVSAFWDVIGEYNQATRYIQLSLLALMGVAVFISFKFEKAIVLKVILGLINLFIAFGFFFTYGTQPIQKYFAFPLFLLTGIIFLNEAIKNRDDHLQKPQVLHYVFFVLYLIYPLVSIAFGNTFPKMVTHIMPCPVATISLVLYSLYSKKNKALLALLTIWGLTGVKSVIFAAYEDIILLAAGIFGVTLLINSVGKKTVN